ncbi:hypothetical protein ACRYCC_38060 [Actinomadura scrupuli]|uniref:hypothetical protein n=1 Tax=Actinomadura scrupuli TaxID=559629 RepID=UPI003D97C825
MEAADWVGRRVLSAAATSWYSQESLLPRLGADMAIGDGLVRRQLHEICRRPVKPGTREQRTLSLLADVVAEGYLSRWQALIVKGREPHMERAARCVAAHMLDQGLHPAHLRREIKSRLGGAGSVEDLLGLFIEMEAEGEREFSGFVLLQGKVPAADVASKSARWLSKETVSALLATDFPQHTSIRNSGGLSFRVRARDPYSAALEMTEVFDRLRNRVRYLRGSRDLIAHPKLFITGVAEPQDFERGDQAVSIRALEKAGVLFDAPVAEADGFRIDDALELAAPLTGSSPSTAVAGAWASLESLLFCDTDEADRDEGRAVAADRAAALVAAGWPRAELTALSYRKEVLSADTRLCLELASVGDENRDRVRILVRWLNSGVPLPQIAPPDLAALRRMSELVEHPYRTLGRVNGYLRGALRRLYRQRNIVLHGGSTRSVALRASLRTAGPLVGAALDRIAHGYTATEISPLDLATRAQLALRIVEDPDGWPLHELLGT